MKQKLTYIISGVNRSQAFESLVRKLDTSRIELSFLILSEQETELHKFLVSEQIPVRTIYYSGKRQMLSAILKIRSFIKHNKTDIVHAHLFDATIAGCIAAKLTGVKKIIYTRHHSTLHHVYHPSGIKWDKLCNRLATTIVSISDTVSKVLIEMEGVSPQKIVKIWHGFDLGQFANADEEKVNALRNKYQLSSRYPVVGVISRFTVWKGIQHIIPAFSQVLKEFPRAKLLLFNAKGDYETVIHQLLKELPDDSYQCVSFENEIASVYHTFNVFVHTPIDDHSEAFGQTYIESMAAGTPLVATRSGIGTEIIEDKKNCLVVPYNDPKSIASAIITLMQSESLRKELTRSAQETVMSRFGIDHMIKELERLYIT